MGRYPANSIPCATKNEGFQCWSHHGTTSLVLCYKAEIGSSEWMDEWANLVIVYCFSSCILHFGVLFMENFLQNKQFHASDGLIIPVALIPTELGNSEFQNRNSRNFLFQCKLHTEVILRVNIHVIIHCLHLTCSYDY